MKTRIFLAFLLVIFTALLLNFIFGWLIIRDFNNYIRSVKEDQFYWIVASVEDGYSNGRWDRRSLSDSIHWAMMLGFDIKILDEKGREVISLNDVMDRLSDPMKKRMEGLFHIHKTGGEYKSYPLHFKDKRIGTLLVRSFQKDILKEKEEIFRERAKNFVFISLIIAGVGLLVIAFLSSQYLSRPIMRLRSAAEEISKGNRDIRIDITGSDEIGDLARSFNVMVESLKREEELRKHLMSNIAHELRTPLTIIKTHIEAIEDGIIRDRDKGLENIKGEINRLIKLIKGIEDITTAEASFFTKGEVTEVNLKEFLSELLGELRPAFKEKGLEITLMKQEEIVVATDIEKLEKILRNLLSNALKFTERGGVWIDYGLQEGNFYIEIKDSGRGIPEDKIPFIFNRFYRIEGSGSEGIGLGLAIVKELVDIMGGRIEVQSRINEGSTFRVYLPKG